MTDESGLTQGVTQQVPHLWYDLIGRVVPGGFLLAGIAQGVYASPYGCIWSQDIHRFFELGAAVTLPALATAAWIAGFVLAQISYYLVERGLFALFDSHLAKVPPIPPPVQEFLPSYLTCDRMKFDFCFNYLWTQPRGGAIVVLASKRDAEVLASRSLAAAALMLAALDRLLSCRPGHTWIYIVYGVVTFFSLTSYSHYQARVRQTRFDGVVSLLGEDKWQPPRSRSDIATC